MPFRVCIKMPDAIYEEDTIVIDLDFYNPEIHEIVASVDTPEVVLKEYEKNCRKKAALEKEAVNKK